MKIVFFGTPSFSAKILEYLIEHGQNVVAVVTRPDRPRGRSQKMLPAAVKALSKKKWPNIPVFTPEKASSPEFVEQIKPCDADVFIVASYGEILKKNLLEVPKKMSINVHPSLLPKHRGPTPYRGTILAGDKETGVTIIEMVLKMDAGDMLDIVKIPLDEDILYGELEEKLSRLSGPALLRVLKKIELGTLEKTPQNHEAATFTKKITLEDRQINWDRPAEEIHNQVRAYSPLPGAFAIVEIDGQTKRLGIKKTKKILNESGQPGQTISWDKEQWIIACDEGAVSLLEVQLEGKKVMSIQEFLRGQSQKLHIK